MKLNRLDTHDKLLEFKQQSASIGECCQSLIDQRPFGEHPFYIFAHKRTLELHERYDLFITGKYPDFSQVPFAKLIWQPRLTKPEAQSNSMLFKAYPGTDGVKIIWIIPQEELWDQYDKGKMTEDSIVFESIKLFRSNRAILEAKEPDDLSEAEIDAVYTAISRGTTKKAAKFEMI